MPHIQVTFEVTGGNLEEIKSAADDHLVSLGGTWMIDDICITQGVVGGDGKTVKWAADVSAYEMTPR